MIQKYNLKNGEKLSGKIVPTDPQQIKAGVQLQAVTAYNTKGQTKDLTALTDGSGTLNWTSTDGDWEIYAAFWGTFRLRQGSKSSLNRARIQSL